MAEKKVYTEADIEEIAEKLRRDTQGQRMSLKFERNKRLKPRGILLWFDDVADDFQATLPSRYVIAQLQDSIGVLRLTFCNANLVKKLLKFFLVGYCIIKKKYNMHRVAIYFFDITINLISTD